MAELLGSNVIQSATEFEAAVAELIATEARLLNTLLDMNPPGWVLLNANCQILHMISQLRWLEEVVIDLVDAGIRGT